MGYERALSALYLEESERVPQVEYISHTEFIAKISGLNPLEKPREAQSLAFTKLDLDMIWFTYTPLEDFIAKRYESIEVRGDSWSQAYPTAWRRIIEVKSIDEILDFDPFREWSIPPLEDLAEHFREIHGEYQSIYSGQLVPGGTYHTCLMWLIKMFGLNWVVKAAYVDPKGFERLLGRFGELSLLEAKAWSQTDIKAFISHDDICSTRGPFFPINWMRKYLFPWYKRIWRELKSKGIIVLFCTDGDMTPIVDDIAEAGADGFIIEECSNLNLIAEKYGNEKVIVGGVDIGRLTYGAINDVIDEVKRCLRVAGSYPGYFINVSGSIPDNVPLINLETYFRAVKKYGRKQRTFHRG
ncbi:MAG: uroporphyrinogen decarboxylase family protein [Candidatus Bathyarchaeia archaeon]